MDGGDFPRQEDRQNGRQLGRGGAFADHAGLDGDGDIEIAQDGNAGEDQDIAADDHHGQPAGNGLLHGQGHEGRYQQKLVGNGVEVGPQDGFLVEPAGKKPVQPVTDTGQKEHQERQPVMPLDHKDHEQRRDQDSEKRQQIGDVDHGAAGPPLGLFLRLRRFGRRQVDAERVLGFLEDPNGIPFVGFA